MTQVPGTEDPHLGEELAAPLDAGAPPRLLLRRPSACRLRAHCFKRGPSCRPMGCKCIHVSMQPRAPRFKRCAVAPLRSSWCPSFKVWFPLREDERFEVLDMHLVVRTKRLGDAERPLQRWRWQPTVSQAAGSSAVALRVKKVG